MCDLKSEFRLILLEAYAHEYHRDPRCGRTLRVGDAFWDWKDRVSPVLDRGISAILSRTPQADILLT